MTLDDLKPQKRVTEEELKKRYIRKNDKFNRVTVHIDVPEVPKGKRVDKFLNDLPTEQREVIKKKIVTKALEDLSPINRQAIESPKLRQQIVNETTQKFEPQCRVCNSRFYSVYLDWMVVDKKSDAECSQLAEIVCGEKIELNSFWKHKKHHLLKDRDTIRRTIMIGDMKDPKSILLGTLQLISEGIAKAELTDGLPMPLLKMQKEYLKLCVELEKINKSVPAIDNSKTQIIQINQGGNIPVAEDTKRLLQSGMTDAEKDRLEVLQQKWENKGTNRIKAIIPIEVPVVDPSKKVAKGNIIKIDEE